MKSGVAKTIGIVASLVVVVCLLGVCAIGFQYCSQQRYYDELSKYFNEGDNAKLSDLSVDWKALREVNPDVVAWVYLPDSHINYPVVQGKSNEEYLHKLFDGTTGWMASAGTVFLDAANDPAFNDRNNALYGHHMRDGSMFASLADWGTTKDFNKHRIFYVLTPKGNYECMTFAYLNVHASEPIVQTSFSSDQKYREFIQGILDRSLVKQKGTVLSAKDINQSYMLATCEYTQNNGRAVIFASVVQTTVQDDPYVAPSANGGSIGMTNKDAKDLKLDS